MSRCDANPLGHCSCLRSSFIIWLLIYERPILGALYLYHSLCLVITYLLHIADVSSSSCPPSVLLLFFFYLPVLHLFFIITPLWYPPQLHPLPPSTPPPPPLSLLRWLYLLWLWQSSLCAFSAVFSLRVWEFGGAQAGLLAVSLEKKSENFLLSYLIERTLCCFFVFF